MTIRAYKNARIFWTLPRFLWDELCLAVTASHKMVGETVSRLRASFCAVIRAPLFPLNSRQRSSKLHKVRRSFFFPRPRPRASLWPPRNAQAQAGLCRRRGKRNQRERTRKRKQNYYSLFQLIAIEPCKKSLLMRPCFCASEKRWCACTLHGAC